MTYQTEHSRILLDEADINIFRQTVAEMATRKHII